MSMINGSDEMQQTQGPGFYGDLEEYLSEVEKRTQRCVSDDDIYGQLAQKEKDLVLAAELGKALLEKNEEISRANEKLAEEYSLKLELLEQEKHGLRRKLEVLEGEYESRVAELQTDLAQLRQELTQQHQLHKTAEKEKGQLLEELTQQNHRLTSELKQAARVEDQLQSQLQSLREQFNVRRSNLHDHVSQLEGLREEINLLCERKSELERRIAALSDEREGLNVSLEESSDKILLLERQNREQEQQLRAQQRDLEQLRQTNSQLQNRLDTVMLLKRNSPTPTPGGANSLLDEIEMMSDTSSHNNQNGKTKLTLEDVVMHHDEDDDDIECDDDLAAIYQQPLVEGGQLLQLQQELVPIYHQLRRLCEDLRRRRDDCSSADSGISSSPEELQAHHLRFGMLTAVTNELKNLIEEAFANNDDDTPCMSCQAVLEEREALERIQKELGEKKEELKKKNEEITALSTKLTLQATELATLRESRDQLRNDMSHSDLAKDQVVKKAWEVRDQAVARKNAVEIELAKTRIDVLHINSQLMEAVQQKVELSQQLEQWQMDMAVLLDEQVMKKLKTQEAEDKKRHQNNNSNKQSQVMPPNKRPTPTKSKLFGLWR